MSKFNLIRNQIKIRITTKSAFDNKTAVKHFFRVQIRINNKANPCHDLRNEHG